MEHKKWWVRPRKSSILQRMSLKMNTLQSHIWTDRRNGWMYNNRLLLSSRFANVNRRRRWRNPNLKKYINENLFSVKSLEIGKPTITLNYFAIKWSWGYMTLMTMLMMNVWSAKNQSFNLKPWFDSHQFANAHIIYVSIVVVYVQLCVYLCFMFSVVMVLIIVQTMEE